MPESGDDTHVHKVDLRRAFQPYDGSMWGAISMGSVLLGVVVFFAFEPVGILIAFGLEITAVISGCYGVLEMRRHNLAPSPRIIMGIVIGLLLTTLIRNWIDMLYNFPAQN